MPDLNQVIDNHHNTMQKWWRVPEYIHERELFVARHPTCIRCGRHAVTPGHSHEDYVMFERYLDAVRTDKCDPLCSACNLMERKSMKPCPKCVIAYRETNGQTKIHYIPQFMELCRDCCDPGEVALKAKEQDAFKDFVRKVRDNQNKKRRKFYREMKKNGR